MAPRSRFAVYLRARADDERAGWRFARLLAHVTMAAVVATPIVLIVERLSISRVTAPRTAAPTALEEPPPEEVTQPETREFFVVLLPADYFDRECGRR